MIDTLAVDGWTVTFGTPKKEHPTLPCPLTVLHVTHYAVHIQAKQYNINRTYLFVGEMEKLYCHCYCKILNPATINTLNNFFGILKYISVTNMLFELGFITFF